MDNIDEDTNTEARTLRRSNRKRKAGEEPTAAPRVRVKKRRGGPGSGRKRKGRLEKIVDLPVDVVLEIFSWLNPVDLLHISHTSKSWRSLLMTRSSISVWRAARSNLSGFPDCPDDLTEPQYANLAFGRTCSFCARTYSNTRLVWTARLRTCGHCISTHFTRSLLSFHLESESTEYPHELKNIYNIPYLRSYEARGCGKSRWITLYVPKEIYARLLDEYWETRNKEAWLKQYKEKYNTMEMHAEAFDYWQRHGRNKI